MKNTFLNSEETKTKYINAINSTKIDVKNKINKIFINHNNIDGAFLEITGNVKKSSYEVSFYNKNTNKLIYKSNLKCNMWTKINIKYFVNWYVEVKDKSGEIIFKHELDLKGKRVFLTIDSSSIGDNIAWIPYFEEFRKKHDCELIVSTFWNHLFEKKYPNIKFVTPGVQVNSLYAMYKIGCFYDSNLEPELCNTLPLQKVATNILGLEHKEIKPYIDFDKKENWPFSLSKYVAIAPHSTAGLKYWNNPTGWQEVVNFLKEKGYRVFNVSREGCELDGVENLEDYSIREIMRCISGSEFFMGLSSGLSWLAWAINKHVFLISNFTNKEHEFSSNCSRIINTNVCNSCWNKSEFKFDKGDWNWCPIHKGTERHFECSKSITGSMVIDRIVDNFPQLK